MRQHKLLIGFAAACLALAATAGIAVTQASADDARLTVAPAIYRTDDGQTNDDGNAGVQTELVRWRRGGWGGGHGWRGGYRGYGYGGYGGWGGGGYYRPYGYRAYRPYYGYGAGYGYPAYSYGYGRPWGGYGYGYPGYGYGGVGIGVW